MNVLKKQVGWLILVAGFAGAIFLLATAPRTVDLPEISENSNRQEQESSDLPPPLNLRSSPDQYVSEAERNPFQPPRRWSSVPPQDPPDPPVPDLTLPNPLFVLPLPPSRGDSWSPLLTERSFPDTIQPPDLAELKSIAKSVKKPSDNQRDTEKTFTDQFQSFDRVYLENQDRWIRGKITDRRDLFITFRLLSSGQIRRFSTKRIRIEESRNPIEAFRSELKKKGKISDRSQLNTLVDRALSLGLPGDAASLIERFARDRISDDALYRRAAELYDQAGSPEKAVNVLRSALQNENAARHELLFSIARRQWEIGLKEQALESLRKSIDERPLFIRARLLRFLYFHDLNRPSKAESELRKLKSETGGKAQDAPESKLYQFARALYHWSFKDRSHARQFLDNLPSPSRAPENYSFAWTRALALRSRIHLENGEVEQALSVLSNGLKQHGSSYPLWYNLGALGVAMKQNDLADLCFSVCDQLAPYRLEHRLAREQLQNNGNVWNVQMETGAVQSGNNAFLHDYKNALQSLNDTAPENTGTAGTPETAQSDSANLSPAEYFERVYRRNQSFVPGAFGLAYQYVQSGDYGDARSLLLHSVPDGWIKHYLMAYSLARSDRNREALQYLQESKTSEENAPGSAYRRALTAYLLLKLGRTNEATKTIADLSPEEEKLSSYLDRFRTIFEQAGRRRRLEDTFERSASGAETSIGRGWTTGGEENGITVKRQEGKVVLSGTQNSAYGFTRLSRPTGPQFISAEFSGHVSKAPETVLIGVGLMDTGGGNPQGLLLVGMKPGSPRMESYVRAGDFAPPDSWANLTDNASANPALPSRNGSFSIRLYRSDSSNQANWSVDINGRTISLDRFAPAGFNDTPNRSVFFFVTGPQGASMNVQLDRFQLVHEFNE